MVSSCEFCEIYMNTFFTVTSPATTSLITLPFISGNLLYDKRIRCFFEIILPRNDIFTNDRFLNENLLLDLMLIIATFFFK